jgi:hypothetical protein
VFGRHGVDLEELLLGADTALYQAKAAGRDRVFVAPDRPLGTVAGIGAGSETTASEVSGPSSSSGDPAIRLDDIDVPAPVDQPGEPSLGSTARRPVR